MSVTALLDEVKRVAHSIDLHVGVGTTGLTIVVAKYAHFDEEKEHELLTNIKADNIPVVMSLTDLVQILEAARLTSTDTDETDTEEVAS